MTDQNNTPETWQPNRGPVAKVIAGVLLALMLAGLIFMVVYAW